MTPSTPDPVTTSRRSFLRLAGAGLGAAAFGMYAPRYGSASAASLPRAEAGVAPPARESRMLLAGTPWQTPLSIARAEQAGPTVLMLGGVHGNEPGAWMAAEDIAQWVPTRGTLLVVPRANVVAIEAEERTLPSLGDLNRLYPGTSNVLPMSRMAAAIIEVAREFHAEVLYDMHESWEFFAERPRNGNAYLGQTITSGPGPDSSTIAKDLVSAANRRITQRRDRMVARMEFSSPMPKTIA